MYIVSENIYKTKNEVDHKHIYICYHISEDLDVLGRHSEGHYLILLRHIEYPVSSKFQYQDLNLPNQNLVHFLD